MAEDAALTRAEQLFTKEAIEKLENTAWKERVAGVEAMTELVRQMPGVKAPDEFLDDDSLIPAQVCHLFCNIYEYSYDYACVIIFLYSLSDHCLLRSSVTILQSVLVF